MIDYDSLVDKELIKSKLIDYLKKNFDKYKNLDFDESNGQSFIVDVQSYLTNLVSNRFEQQVQDFYLTTSQTDKINLLLSQYGYTKTFGIPSQCILKLDFTDEQMYELNELNIDVIFVPPLVLKIQDDNGNIWLNKNSLLIMKTPEKFQYQTKIMDENNNTKTVTKDFYKYKITSFIGVDEIPFVQMDYFIRTVEGSGKRFEKIQILQKSEGYPVHNFRINDYIDIDLSIRPFIVDQVRSTTTLTMYKLFSNIKEFVQSKYHTNDYETFIRNEYMVVEYDEVNEVFNLINGDNEVNGYNLNGQLTLGFYRTKGDEGYQLLGSVNTYIGLSDYLMLNNNLYYLNTPYLDSNLKMLFIPNRVLITKDLKTGQILSNEIENDENQQIFIQNLFDIKNSNEVMNKYGYKPLNILVTQVEPVITGKGQETLDTLKFNFSQFLRQKDKIVTRKDIEQYLNNFLKNVSHSLNQVGTYKNQFSRVYVDKIKNVLKILPVVLKTDNLKQITFPKGSIIYPSELPETLTQNQLLNYTYEKESIIKELKEKIIQTMEVEYQDWELLKIYTKKPILLNQLDEVSINSILQQLKDKLNTIVDVKTKFYDIFTELNFMDMIMSLNKIEGLKTIDVDEFMENISVKGYKEFKSGYILPLQLQRYKGIRNKIKSVYFVPINTHQDDEDLISDTLKLDMFNTQQGETDNDNVDEVFQDENFYTTNYIYPQPVNVNRNIEVDVQNIENQEQSSLLNLNYLFDPFMSMVTKYKNKTTFNKNQIGMFKFKVIERIEEELLKDKYKYVEDKDMNVECEMNMQIKS